MGVLAPHHLQELTTPEILTMKSEVFRNYGDSTAVCLCIHGPLSGEEYQ